MFVLPTVALVSDRKAALSGDGKTPPPPLPPLVPLPTAVDAPGADVRHLFRKFSPKEGNPIPKRANFLVLSP